MLLWAVLFAVAFGTNVPTPLLLLYQEALSLSATATVGIFAMYAVGLIVALLPAGFLSDRRGRRAIALPSVIVATVATLLFLVGRDSLTVLLAARFIQGVASGAVFGVSSAWLQELSVGAGATAGARRVATALSGGFAMGPVVAGGLGQWAPSPLTLPYLVHAVLMGLAVAAAWMARDVVATAGRVIRVDVRLMHLSTGERHVWLRFLLPVAFCVFAFPSTSLTIIPLLLRATTGELTVAGAGAIISATLLTGALVQPVAHRLGYARAAILAPLAGCTGALLCVLAAALSNWPPLVPAALLLGAAYGLGLFAGLAVVGAVTSPERRGLMTSIFYSFAYLGFAVPWLVSAVEPVAGFAAPLLALAITGAALVVVLSQHRSDS